MQDKITDWCATCLKPLERLPHGAYKQCCDGMAYWSTFGERTNPVYRRGSVTGVKVWYYERVPGGGI